MTTLDLPPSADLTGDWQQTRPLPVDSVGYIKPTLLTTMTDAYSAGDASAAGEQAGALTLPTLSGGSLASISHVGSTRNTEADAISVSTSHVTDFVADIQTDDFLLLHSVIWTDSTAVAPDTPSGWTLLVSWKDTNAYAPRITTWYKVATASEASTQTVTHGTAVKMGVAMEAYRGVDTSNPFDVTEVGPVYGTDDPDPSSITPITNGAMVIAWGGVQEWPAQAITPPSGYTLSVDTADRTIRSIFSAYKLQATAAAENPGAFTKSADRTVTGTMALRPKVVSGGRTIIVAATSADGTATTVAGDCTLDAIDEVQAINSTLVAGTFTLTLNAETTGNINWDDSASAIQTALEGLASVSVGDVVCSGGPLDESAVFVEFANGLGAQDVAIMTASSGSVTISESQKGYAASAFDFEGSINMPRSGGSNEPQAWVWSHTPSAYVAGRTITVDVADHDTLKSYSIIGMVWSDLDTTTPVESIGAIDTGSGSVADVGSITPTTRGARALAFLAKALSTGNYTDGQGAVAIARTVSAASSVADSMSLDAFVTPPLDATALDLGATVWTGSELWAAAVASLRPADPPSAGLDLADVLTVNTLNSWIEVAATAGDLFEVVEFNVASIPADAHVIGLSARFVHEGDALHRLRLTPCVIKVDDTIVLGDESSTGHRPEPLGDQVTVETTRVDQLVDGSNLDDYTRYGVAVRSDTSTPGLTTHKLYSVELVAEILTGGPVVASVSGPSTPGDPVSWTYSSAGGFVQTHYQVMIIQGASQDPDSAVVGNPWGGTTGHIIYDSGQIADSAARSLEVPSPLNGGTCTYAVRAWARLGGRLRASDWTTVNIDIAGAAPTAPSISSAASFSSTTGVVTVEATTPANATRLFLHRSTDGGSTFKLVGDMNTVGASTTGSVIDPEPVFDTDMIYRVGNDSGPMTESNWVAEGTRNYTSPGWFLQAVSDSTLNTQIYIVGGSLARRRPRSSLRVVSGSSSAVLSTPEQPSDWSMTLRADTKAQRDAIDALLAHTGILRLVSVLGEAWYVRLVGDVSEALQRWKPVAGETTNLRDAHHLDIELAEVSLWEGEGALLAIVET